MSNFQQAVWKPSFSERPRNLRMVRVTAEDAAEWTAMAIRCADDAPLANFRAGVELGMAMIRSELILPVDRELKPFEIMFAFALATANRRKAKLALVLHLVHDCPGDLMLHRGLRFVAACLWASYASLGIEGEENKLQSIKMVDRAKGVWARLSAGGPETLAQTRYA